MFGLLKKCVPKYHFSKSKAKEGFCRPRYKIFPYLKEIFLQNRDKITNHVLSSDLQYTSLVAQNYHSFQINDDELRSFIVTNVDFRELDYTPQLVVEIAASLKPIIKYSESEILESIWAYTDEFHFFI